MANHLTEGAAVSEQPAAPPKGASAGIAKLFGIAAVLICAGAGIYLLQAQSASEETTVFDLLMHGIGAYFLARAAWMASQLHRGAW